MLSASEIDQIHVLSTQSKTPTYLGFATQKLDKSDPKNSATLKDFSGTIEREFIEGSAIAPTFYRDVIRIVSDTEVMPGGEVTYPIAEALNWKVTRFGYQARETLFAALFTNEDGSTWQAKLSRNLKVGKKPYLAPKGGGSRAYFPSVPVVARQHFSQKYGIEFPSEGSFWDFVDSHPEITIIFTEGGKKSLCLLSAGYVSIALYGVNSGYRSKDEWGNKIPLDLIPDVARFAVPGRKIVLAFDQDEKPETRRRVSLAVSRFGGLLTAAGCDVCVGRWDGKQGKGVDDLIASQGVEAWETAYAEALSLEHWQIWQQLANRLTYPTALRLSAADLSKITIEDLPESGILAIASPKGTGKTKFAASLVINAEKVLAAGHRIALMRNLSTRLGLDYKGDLDKVNGQFINGSAYTLRVGLCVDSLMAINPESFRGCILVLDEVVQVLRHLLTSSTCGKDGKRPALLARLKELVRVARLVVVADADLDNATLRYLAELRGDDRPVFLLRNDYQPQGYPTQFIQSPDRSAIVAQFIREVKTLEPKKVMLATMDSLRSSKSLACLIAHESPEKRVLCINSETSGGEVEQEFIQSPDAVLARNEYDVIICTPSMATGVSIEAQGVIVRVYGIFTGASSTDADMAQALARVREPVERVVWCAKRGSNFCRVSRSTNALELKSLLQQKTSATIRLIRSNLREDIVGSLESYDWQSDPHVNLFCSIEAERNRSMWHLRDALLVRLKFEGNQVTIDNRTSDASARILLKQARDELKQIDAEALVAARILSYLEVVELESKEGISPEDRTAIARYHLCEFYCLEPKSLTLDDVLRDKEGRRRGELLNLEAQLFPDLTIDRTARALEKQASWNQGLCPWDISGVELRRVLRELLGLNEFLTLDRGEWTKYDLKDCADRIRSKPQQVKLLLNFTVNPEISDVQLVHQLLSQLGVKVAYRWSRSMPGHEGEKLRVYRLDACQWSAAMDILNRRAAKRESYQKEVPDSGSPAQCESSKGVGDPVNQLPELAQWLTPESLTEIREQWKMADCPESQAALRQVIPPDVWRLAIA